MFLPAKRGDAFAMFLREETNDVQPMHTRGEHERSSVVAQLVRG